jgi:DNA-binding transcriptional regulator YiaG
VGGRLIEIHSAISGRTFAGCSGPYVPELRRLSDFTSDTDHGTEVIVSTLRDLRHDLGLTQAQFAKELNVALETYRPWDAGRATPPFDVLRTAWALAGSQPDDALLLQELASILQVHVRTLRHAARDGRLAVTFDSRCCFGKVMPRATRAAGQAFKRVYYRQTTRWSPRPAVPTPLPAVPDHYHAELVGIRRRLGFTQSQLAASVGAAGKAVVYQWEARKRKPSPVFWQKIQALAVDP